MKSSKQVFVSCDVLRNGVVILLSDLETEYISVDLHPITLLITLSFDFIINNDKHFSFGILSHKRLELYYESIQILSYH